jgi:hypothetical protein
MALTINRKHEISKEQLEYLMKKFKQKTYSKAIYATVQYVIDQVPTIECELNIMKCQVNDARVKYKEFMITGISNYAQENQCKSPSS